MAKRYHTVSTPLLVEVTVCSACHPAGAVALAKYQYEKNASIKSPFCTPVGTEIVALVVEVEPTSVIAADARDALAISNAITAAAKIEGQRVPPARPGCPLSCRDLRLKVFPARIPA